EGDLVTFAQECECEQVVRFAGAVGDFKVIDGRARVLFRELFAQRDRAVRLAVPERHIHERVEIKPRFGELNQPHRTHAALAHIDLDEVLPRRLHALHFEQRNLQLAFSQTYSAMYKSSTPSPVKSQTTIPPFATGCGDAKNSPNSIVRSTTSG